jgi:hypothetical protein
MVLIRERRAGGGEDRERREHLHHGERERRELLVRAPDEQGAPGLSRT